MNNEVSSNYLYHFTKKLDSIQNILSDKAFKPFYCLERLDYLSIYDESSKSFELAFPMVCFCDLTEDKQQKHREKFGAYSISLSKDWGRRQILTPVSYCSERTHSAVSLKILIQFSKKIHSIIPDEEFNKLNNSVSILLMHFKSYEGYEYDKDLKCFKLGKTRFYDEREWRYFPLVNKVNWCLTREQYENKSNLNEENKKIQKNNCLNFNLSDIVQIQLKDEKEIDFLLNKLKEKYSEEELSILNDKIKIVNDGV